MSVTIKTGPESEPVTLTEAKAHLNVTCSDDDMYITTLITVARIHAERYQRRSYITQTLELRLDRFPRYLIELKRPPVSAVATVKYIDSAGDTQTLSSALYTTDFNSYMPRLVPAFNQIWPTTRHVIDAVTIEYTAGYGAAEDVPDTIKQAMLLLIGHWYLSREQVVIGFTVAELPTGVTALLATERVLL